MSTEWKIASGALFIGLCFVAVVFTIIYVVIPKDTLVQSRTAYEVGSFKQQVNQCNKDGGSAYIADERVFCERSSND